MTDRSQPAISDAAVGAVTAEGAAYAPAPQRLQYFQVAAPQPGTAVSVAPGVWWGRIPLPLDLDHINVWLLETPAGYVVVDTGLAADVGKEAWLQIETQLFATRPLHAVLVTHIHPDHLGLAAWLQQRHGVPVWMSKRTHEQAQELLGDLTVDMSDEVIGFFHRHGVTEPQSGRGLFSPQRFARMVSGLPQVEQHVADNQALPATLENWTALQTDGHAEGHLCLHQQAQGLLISGDQVLPTISPNIGLTWRNQDLNPLGSYLRSLKRLRQLDQNALVLPSHGLPFHGLHQRIDDLRAHHLLQLNNLVAACHVPRTAAEILPVMFRRVLKGMHFLLALSEALAHLEYLVHEGRLRRATDDGGVIRYVV